MARVFYYDIEMYPNCMIVIFIDSNTQQSHIDNYINADIDNDTIKMANYMENINPFIFIIMYDEERVIDQLEELLLFVDNPDVMLIGFNNNYYDDILINYAIIRQRLQKQKSTVGFLTDIFEISDSIIEYGYMSVIYGDIFKGYKSKYMSIDCLKSLYETINRKSLKQTMINLKWYNVLDLPIRPGTHIAWDTLSKLIYYCINDVLATRAFYLFNIKEINMKKTASLLYNTILINKNRSSIADALLGKLYCERTNLKIWDIKKLRTFRTDIKISEIIDNRINFTNIVFKNYYNKIKNVILPVGSSKILNASLISKNNRYDIAKGGLHSKDLPGIFKSTYKYAIMDGDVDSYYPFAVVNDKICPEHLFQPIFTDIGKYLISERITANNVKYDKSATLIDIEKANVISDVLKIVLNSGIFGKFGYEKGWLYDLKCLYQVTINNQLRILKWIELLEDANFQVISVNTDGVTAKIERTRIEEYKLLSVEWAKLFNHTVKFKEYNLYVRLNVNSYFAVDTDNNIKEKGRFLRNIALEKGYDKPIVAKALIEYFMNDINIMTYLKAHKDIYDFCISQKLGDDYSPQFHKLIENKHEINELQKNIRYYVCKDGGRIMKTNSKQKVISVLREQVVIFNKFIKYDNISDYNIDYDYYHREIFKIINEIEHKTTKIMKKTSGSMFDEIEEQT